MPAVAGRHPDLDRGGDREAIRVRGAGEVGGGGQKGKGQGLTYLFSVWEPLEFSTLITY